jgi:hypothetical protein
MRNLCADVDSYKDLTLLAFVLLIVTMGQISFTVPIFLFKSQTDRKIFLPNQTDDTLPNFEESYLLKILGVLLGPVVREELLKVEKLEFLRTKLILRLFEEDHKHEHKVLRLDYCQGESFLQIPRYVMLVQLIGAILIVFGWLVAIANDDIRDAYREDGFRNIVTGNFLAIVYLFPIGAGLNQIIGAVSELYFPTFDFIQRLLFRVFYWGSFATTFAFLIIYFPFIYLTLFVFVCLILSVIITFVAGYLISTLVAYSILFTASWDSNSDPSLNLNEINTTPSDNASSSIPAGNIWQTTFHPLELHVVVSSILCLMSSTFGMVALSFILATAITGGPSSKSSKEICIPANQIEGLMSLFVAIITAGGFTISFALILSKVMAERPRTLEHDYSNMEYICNEGQCEGEGEKVIIPDSNIRIFCCRHGHIKSCQAAFPSARVSST